jgi:hypothetical protein
MKLFECTNGNCHGLTAANSMEEMDNAPCRKNHGMCPVTEIKRVHGLDMKLYWPQLIERIKGGESGGHS